MNRWFDVDEDANAEVAFGFVAHESACLEKNGSHFIRPSHERSLSSSGGYATIPPESLTIDTHDIFATTQKHKPGRTEAIPSHGTVVFIVSVVIQSTHDRQHQRQCSSSSFLRRICGHFGGPHAESLALCRSAVNQNSNTRRFQSSTFLRTACAYYNGQEQRGATNGSGHH